MKRVSLLLFLLPIAALAQFNNSTRIWNRAIIPDAPTNGQIYIWNTANNRWQLGSSGGGGTGCNTIGTAGQILSDDGAGGCTSNSTAAGILTFIGTPSSANLAAAITNETGSGLLVFATTPTLTTPVLGVATATSINKLTITAPATSAVLTIPDGVTFTGPPSSGTAATLALSETLTNKTLTSPTLTTPTLGVATATSINKVAITAPATSATLTIPDGVTFTGPPASGTAATLAGSETLTNKTLTTPTIGSFTNAGHDHSNAAGGANITSTAFATGSPIRAGSFGATFDGGGSALTAGSTTARYLVVPYACTIIGWNIEVDTGTATFKLWRIATGGTAIPTVSDSINTSGVAISSGTLVRSTTTSDFTSTAIALNDVIGVNLSAVATATLATFSVQCQK